MKSAENKVRLPFLLIAFAVLVVAVSGFAIFDLMNHRRTAAATIDFVLAILGSSIGLILFFAPQIIFGPLLASIKPALSWIEKHLPQWVYYLTVLLLCAIGIVGFAFLLRVLFAGLR